MKNKRFVWVLSMMAITLFVLTSTSLSSAQDAAAMANGGPAAAAAPVILSQVTRGVVFYTAAINSDGSVASCFSCASATHLGTGQYQVDFGTNVQAANGFSRWTQADTLSTGSTGAYCDTADRAGDTSAVWINCQNAAGTAVDTSFFLFVAR